MIPRYRRRALQRSVIAGLVGIAAIGAFGPLLAVPAVALVALVYHMHPVMDAFLRDVEVPHLDLSFVIVVNSVVILAVQVLLFVAGIRQA
jgi:hypothetical protein